MRATQGPISATTPLGLVNWTSHSTRPANGAIILFGRSAHAVRGLRRHQPQAETQSAKLPRAKPLQGIPPPSGSLEGASAYGDCSPRRAPLGVLSNRPAAQAPSCFLRQSRPSVSLRGVVRVLTAAGGAVSHVSARSRNGPYRNRNHAAPAVTRQRCPRRGPKDGPAHASCCLVPPSPSLPRGRRMSGAVGMKTPVASDQSRMALQRTAT
jgi:hypothetical protein